MPLQNTNNSLTSGKMRPYPTLQAQVLITASKQPDNTILRHCLSRNYIVFSHMISGKITIKLVLFFNLISIISENVDTQLPLEQTTR